MTATLTTSGNEMTIKWNGREKTVPSNTLHSKEERAMVARFIIEKWKGEEKK